MVRSMGAKRHPPFPSSRSSSPAVCCMCGDLGLSEELFRCKSCDVRLQHKYCSNLYPKFQAYIACNWCLRERGDDQTPAAPGDSSGRSTSVKLHHQNAAAAAALPSRRLKIIKGHAMGKRGAALVASEKVAVKKSAGKQEGFRSKIRKFKLLEEVCR